jgi:hypothetical protein
MSVERKQHSCINSGDHRQSLERRLRRLCREYRFVQWRIRKLKQELHGAPQLETICEKKWAGSI